ncbi:MAG TPA: hypothetical protein VFO58_22700 [Vicinamibacterales bacterium]|nr:hypothetical protein [Vicinamibacterales bacterium]
MKRLAAAVSLLVLALSGSPSAQQRGEPTVVLQTPAQGAEITREQLQGLLEQLPPNVRRVLQLDPSLAERPEYLALYPQLQAFLKVHPEVTRNPAYFFGIAVQDFNRNRQAEPMEWFAGILAGIGLFIGFMTVVTILAALVKQAVEYRRWLRQTRMQTEVHTKILDRMQSNEDLLAYIQTPAGKNFLQFTPISTEGAPKVVGAPLSRILWSVQAGVVLAALGLGLRYAQESVPEEIVPAFTVLGVIVMSLGVGAVVSAVVAYLLSARLGLLPARKEETHA